MHHILLEHEVKINGRPTDMDSLHVLYCISVGPAVFILPFFFTHFLSCAFFLLPSRHVVVAGDCNKCKSFTQLREIR